MDPSTQILFELPSVIRVYADGRVERLPGADSDNAPAGVDPATKTTSRDVVIDPATPVRARVYLPESEPDKKLPVVVYYHGGAFIIGSVSEGPTHSFLNSLAAQAKVLIVSVEYRLAPENPIPAAYDDSWAALQWALGTGSDEWISARGDPDRVFLAGESAGANIAHQMALRVGSGSKKLQGMALVHPLFWGSDRIGSEADPYPDNVLKPEQLDGGWQLVCGAEQEADLDDPRLNPLAEGAPALGGLGCERVLVCVAGKDLLRERGRVYWERVKEEKGAAEFFVSEGEDHGFYFDKPDGDKASELIHRLVSFFGGK